MSRLSICLAMVLLLCVGVAYAQPPGNTEIRLKPSAIIGGWVKADTLFIKNDGPIKFPIEYVNRDTNSYNGANAFMVTSPDGATWAHATANGGNVKSLPATMFGIWVDTTGFYPKSDFGGLYKFNLFGADGAGRDTLLFGGASNDPSQFGFRPSDSGIFFYIIIRAKLADTGKHICIDSATRYPPTGTWKWPSFNYVPAYNTFPLWKGGCFVLAYSCCMGLTGNYDCDPEDRCDIADVTAFIARYTTLEMPCCPGEANIDGSSDGNSDISDLTALIDYLYIRFTPPAPCQ
jgi:hypothetical protein